MVMQVAGLTDPSCWSIFDVVASLEVLCKGCRALHTSWLLETQVKSLTIQSDHKRTSSAEEIVSLVLDAARKSHEDEGIDFEQILQAQKANTCICAGVHWFDPTEELEKNWMMKKSMPDSKSIVIGSRDLAVKMMKKKSLATLLVFSMLSAQQRVEMTTPQQKGRTHKPFFPPLSKRRQKTRRLSSTSRR